MKPVFINKPVFYIFQIGCIKKQKNGFSGNRYMTLIKRPFLKEKIIKQQQPGLENQLKKKGRRIYRYAIMIQKLIKRSKFKFINF